MQSRRSWCGQDALAHLVDHAARSHVRAYIAGEPIVAGGDRLPSFVMTRTGPLVPLDKRPLDDAVDPSESLAFGNR